MIYAILFGFLMVAAAFYFGAVVIADAIHIRTQAYVACNARETLHDEL